jgi:hypothetical protein
MFSHHSAALHMTWSTLIFWRFSNFSWIGRVILASMQSIQAWWRHWLVKMMHDSFSILQTEHRAFGTAISCEVLALFCFMLWSSSEYTESTSSLSDCLWSLLMVSRMEAAKSSCYCGSRSFYSSFLAASSISKLMLSRSSDFWAIS